MTIMCVVYMTLNLRRLDLLKKIPFVLFWFCCFKVHCSFGLIGLTRSDIPLNVMRTIRNIGNYNKLETAD